MVESPPSVAIVPDADSTAPLWPSIQETYSNSKEEDWEFVDTAAGDLHTEDSISSFALSRLLCRQLSSSSNNGIYKVMSTPDLNVSGHYVRYDGEEDVDDTTESTNDAFTCVSSTAAEDPFVKLRAPLSTVLGKKPSFKDAILLNLQETVKEDHLVVDARTLGHQQEKRIRKPRFVVKKMTRCALSTGDLTRLSTIHDGDEEGLSSGAGGLPTVPSSDNILGAADAEEFYARKRHGSEARKNGLKLRPDEAKRKEFAMCKRDMQRQVQQSR